MYYIWKRAFYGNNEAFICKLENFKDRRSLVDKKYITTLPSEGFIYNAFDNMLEPEDYPYAGTVFNFLLSNKIVEVIKAFNLNIQYIPSKIIRDDGVVRNDFQTLNILNVINCADITNSEVEITQLKSKSFYEFSKLVLDESKIPSNEKLFWLGEQASWLVVHQDVVDCLEKADVTGVRFIPIDEFEC